MVPEFQPDHLQVFQLDRGDLRAVLAGHAFTDFEFIVIKALLDMGEATMEEGGERPEHLFEIVFQLAVIKQADGGLKERRHGEFNLIWLGQGAVICLTGTWLCAM